MVRIFISYSRADRLFVDDLIPLLSDIYGNDCVWVDDEIPGGSDWWDTILAQIHQCILFLYLVSNDSLKSDYCRKEFHEALRLKKQILPVIVRPKTDYLAENDPHLRSLLTKTQYVDMSCGLKNAAALTKLFAAVHSLSEQSSEHPFVTQNSSSSAPNPQPDRRLAPESNYFTQSKEGTNKSLKSRQRKKSWAFLITGIAVLLAVALIIILSSKSSGDHKDISGGTNTAIALSTDVVLPTMSNKPTPTATQIITFEIKIMSPQIATEIAQSRIFYNRILTLTGQPQEATQVAVVQTTTVNIQEPTLTLDIQTIQAAQYNSDATQTAQVQVAQTVAAQLGTMNAQLTRTAQSDLENATVQTLQTQAAQTLTVKTQAPVVPTATRTPTSTWAPSSSPMFTPRTPSSSPNLRMTYNGESFILTNISTENLNVSNLVFEQLTDNGAWLVFKGYLWDVVAHTPPSSMSPQICYQVIKAGGDMTPPTEDLCPDGWAWYEVEDSSYFWVSSNPNAVFTVHRDGDSTILTTCSIAAGTCSFYLP